MCRFQKLQRLVLAIAVAGLLMGAPADAGLLSRIAREAGDAAGSAGKHVDGAAGLVDEGVSLARKLPRSADGTGVALLPAEGNAWQLVTSGGNSLPIASLDDIGQGLEDAANATRRPLAGDKTPARLQGSGSFQIAIRETDFFKLRDQLHGLPANARPFMIRANGSSYPLKPVGSGTPSRLAVELGPNVLIDPASWRALDGNIRFLSRPVNRSNLKLARFDSAAAQAAAPDGMIVDLNADILESSLAKFKNRTLVVSGRIARNPETGQAQLVVRDGTKVRNIDLETFHSAAERQRVNLMIVESTTPVQPGKSWFSRTAIERRLADAHAAMTQADLMAALSPPNTTTLIHAANERNYRLVTATSHAPTQSAPTAAADDYSAAGWLLDAGIRAGVHSVNSNHEDPYHTDEVEGRWLPWISNVTLIAVTVLVALTVFLSWYLWRWWNRLWGTLFTKSGHGGSGSMALRIVKLLAFLPFAAVMAVPALLWIVVADWVRILTWPFRKAFGR